MGYRPIMIGILYGLLALPCPVHASVGDVGTIIEKFVVLQFPEAIGHYWLINETQWDGDEMIVDVQTVVTERRDSEPHLNRFLLLIVAGELKGAQGIPLESGAECQREENA